MAMIWLDYVHSISERERVIGVHERRSFFRDLWLIGRSLLEMNADLNVIGKCAVIADHKSQITGKKTFLKILLHFDKIIPMVNSKVVFYFTVYLFWATKAETAET